MKIVHTDSKYLSNLLYTVDDLCDKAREKILGEGTKAKEYQIAEAHAIAFRDGGYTGPVPSAVQSWADAKTWTAKEAADDILTAVEKANEAICVIRDLRLKAKEAMKNSKSSVEVEMYYKEFYTALQSITV